MKRKKEVNAEIILYIDNIHFSNKLVSLYTLHTG